MKSTENQQQSEHRDRLLEFERDYQNIVGHLPRADKKHPFREVTPVQKPFRTIVTDRSEFVYERVTDRSTLRNASFLS